MKDLTIFNFSTFDFLALILFVATAMTFSDNNKSSKIESSWNNSNEKNNFPNLESMDQFFTKKNFNGLDFDFFSTLTKNSNMNINFNQFDRILVYWQPGTNLPSAWDLLHNHISEFFQLLRRLNSLGGRDLRHQLTHQFKLYFGRDATSWDEIKQELLNVYQNEINRINRHFRTLLENVDMSTESVSNTQTIRAIEKLLEQADFYYDEFIRHIANVPNNGNFSSYFTFAGLVFLGCSIMISTYLLTRAINNATDQAIKATDSARETISQQIEQTSNTLNPFFIQFSHFLQSFPNTMRYVFFSAILFSSSMAVFRRYIGNIFLWFRKPR